MEGVVKHDRATSATCTGWRPSQTYSIILRCSRRQRRYARIVVRRQVVDSLHERLDQFVHRFLGEQRRKDYIGAMIAAGEIAQRAHPGAPARRGDACAQLLVSLVLRDFGNQLDRVVEAQFLELLHLEKIAAERGSWRQDAVHGTGRGCDQAAEAAVVQEPVQLHFTHAAELLNQVVEVLRQDYQRAVAGKFPDQVKGRGFGFLDFERVDGSHCAAPRPGKGCPGIAARAEF